MRKCIKCLYLLIVAIFISCDKNNSQESNLEYIQTKDGQLLDVIKDSILYYNIENCHFANTDIINPNQTGTLNGFLTSETQRKHWVKVIFSNGEAFGLQNGMTYYARNEMYYQHISTNNNGQIAIPYTSQVYSMGIIDGNDLYNIGYIHSSGEYYITDIPVNCQTTLFYIGYDLKGNPINKYFPCNPKDLTWNYSWFNLNK